MDRGIALFRLQAIVARSQGGLHSTGRNEKVEHCLKRIWNECIYQKDKGIEDKQMTVGLKCCQNTHCEKNRTGTGIWLSCELGLL